MITITVPFQLLYMLFLGSSAMFCSRASIPPVERNHDLGEYMSQADCISCNTLSLESYGS